LITEQRSLRTDCLEQQALDRLVVMNNLSLSIRLDADYSSHQRQRDTGAECKRNFMPKIAVFRFFWRDTETGQNVENPCFATLKAIKLHDGRNIEASRRIVDDNDIDNKGFLKNT
jgi:hypothetical protein